MSQEVSKWVENGGRGCDGSDDGNFRGCFKKGPQPKMAAWRVSHLDFFHNF